MNKLTEALKLLPISLMSDPFTVAMFEAAIIQLQEMYEDALQMFDLVNIDKLPEELLDLIAFEKHVDFYDGNLSVEQKRSLIKKSIGWHRQKGTRWAVEEIVSIIYSNAEVLEWFEYGGEPYRFKIEIDQPFVYEKDMNRLKKLVNSTKNLRSWLEYVAIKLPQTQYIELACDHFQYPVHLPICGTFYCDGIPGTKQDTTIEMQSEQYHYPVSLPITGEIYPNEVINEW